MFLAGFFELRNALRDLTFDLTRDTTMASLTQHVGGDVAWRHVLECEDLTKQMVRLELNCKLQIYVSQSVLG